MIRRPPRSTLSSSSAASDVYKRQGINAEYGIDLHRLMMQARVQAWALWVQAQIDRWADRYLINAPQKDHVLYTKWLAHIENQSREGRRLWCMLLWGLYFAVAGLWDWVLLYLVVVVCPIALATSSGRFERYCWLNHLTLHFWLLLAVTTRNKVHVDHLVHAAAGCSKKPWAFAPDDTRFFFGLFWLTTYLEVSVDRFSVLAFHHAAIQAVVRVTTGPTSLAPAFTLVMGMFFCFRRRWTAGATDRIAAQMAQDQLNESRIEMRALRNLSALKSEFLRTLCHELRNPMSAVQGNCEMFGVKADKFAERELAAEESAELEEMRKFSQNALLSLKHVMEVLNNTLTMAKLEDEQGIVVAQTDAVNIKEVLESVHQMFEITAQCKGIKLRLDLPESLETLVVHSSTNWLKQIVINLLSNSLKFTFEGSIVTRVRQLSASEGSTTLEFGVADTGLGMTQEQIQLLFRPFSPVSYTHLRAHETPEHLVCRLLLEKKKKKKRK
eukprot:TRINITY_DN25970_c0_g1_i1.p1 TRINITY_DN25970_c0_g1~~TRINITY_DN25970_c0_g1_i1.p1  ORF type:complete len:497 (-),score=144.20 TRINITY_DN25970_c0_g1_i1:109-1599(-)